MGPWDPLNNFGNLYEAMVIVHEQIDDFIASTEEQKTAPTPKAGDQLPPQTPSRRNANSLANKAKMLNSQLLDLQSKLQHMEDVSYEKKKLDLVYLMAERSLEQKGHLDIIVERLKVLESMNKESPNLEAKMQAIVQNATTVIPKALLEEQEQSD